jgi:uncharacterized protein with GYD domain
MPQYMARFQYSPDARSALLKNPEDRTEAVHSILESVGGQLPDMRYTLGGGYTGFTLTELPDEIGIAAMGALTSTSRALGESTDITQVLTAKEMVEALHRAKKCQYTAPGR